MILLDRLRAKWPRSFVLIGCALFCAFATFAGPNFLERGKVSAFTNPVDFRAFYCAGQVYAEHRDPYRIEPLRSCERAAAGDMGLAMYPNLVVPAPLPPYALIPFSAISRLPFVNAVALWFALLFLSSIAVVASLREITRIPLPFLAVVWTCATFPALMLGQMIPLVVCFTVLAAMALHRARYATAAVCAAATMIEPHVGLPICLTIFIAVTRARLALAISAIVIVCGVVASGGTALAIEYATIELPLHARSELLALQAQHSLATVLAVFGTPRDNALAW